MTTLKYNTSNFKKDLDQHIGTFPLIKNQDMERFNEWLSKQGGKKAKKQLFPQVVTGFMVLIILCISFILVKSSLFEKDLNMASMEDEENITAIETILNHQFNGPDYKLIELWEEKATIIGGNGETSAPEQPTKLDKYLAELYQPYFTDNMYEKYLSSFAMSYQTPAYKNGYEIKVAAIDIKEKTEDAYDFKVSVIYHKNGESKQNTAEVTGSVHIYEPGKIASIKFLNDSGLLKTLINGK